MVRGTLGIFWINEIIYSLFGSMFPLLQEMEKRDHQQFVSNDLKGNESINEGEEAKVVFAERRDLDGKPRHVYEITLLPLLFLTCVTLFNYTSIVPSMY